MLVSAISVGQANVAVVTEISASTAITSTYPEVRISVVLELEVLGMFAGINVAQLLNCQVAPAEVK